MTKRTPTKLAVSILNQLRKLARERGDDLQLVLLRHVNERLLYRLAQSTYRNSFVLKGAALFTVWTGQPSISQLYSSSRRPTSACTRGRR